MQQEGDDVNPKKASSGSQFYIVEGKKFTDAGLDSFEIRRLHGRKIPAESERNLQNYWRHSACLMADIMFGEVIKGLNVVDSISFVRTDTNNRPIKDIRIIKMKLIKRKN